MNINVYPAGSQHQNKDVWASLPRVDMGIVDVRPSNKVWIGVFWAGVIEASMGLIGWALWMMR